MTRKVVYTLLVIILVSIPNVVQSKYIMQLINTTIVFLIIAMGLNFVIGYAGQISLAQTAFWGVGAYTSALLTTKLGVSFWLALPLAALLAALGGFLIGFPTLRLKHFYLGIATVGFGEIFVLMLLNWTSLTNGSDGIPGIPKPRLGSLVLRTDFQYYYLLLILALILFVVATRIKYSRFGRGLFAIREDELAAELSGIPTHKYKMFAFALSAFYAGIAGSLYAHLIGYISPDLFIFRQSIVFLCMLMVGGAGFVAGPVIGAVFLTLLPEWMRFLKDFYMGIYGIAVVLLAILMPSGVTGLIEKYSPALFAWLEPSERLQPRGEGEKVVPRNVASS